MSGERRRIGICLLVAVLLTVLASVSVGCISAASTQYLNPGGSIQRAPIDEHLDAVPVILFFYADWCHFCHLQIPIIDELEQEYTGELAFIRINADECPDTVLAFEVNEFPTMFIISAYHDGGYNQQKISGFVEKARLKELVELELGKGSDELELKITENLLQTEESTNGSYVGWEAELNAESSVTCTSCEDCTTKLNSGLYDTVILSQNILNHTGNCITLEADNVVFDCSGYFISGDFLAAPLDFDYGIRVTGGNNVVTKCNVGLFWYGMWLDFANFTTITENNMALNGYSGLTLSNSNNNYITANTMNFNSYGLAILNSYNTVINSNAACGNLIADIWQENASGNTGSNNTCYNTHNWNDTGTTGGCTHLCCLVPSNDMHIEKDTKFCPGNYSINDTGYTGVIIINQSNITLDCNNASLKGDRSGVGIYNNGFDNVTIKNCNISYYYEGIELNTAKYNNLEGNTANSNNNHGIYLWNSSNHNTLTGNTASNNQYGIRLYFSSNHNTLASNTASNNYYDGIILYSSSGNTLTDNNANVSNSAGIWLYSSSNNSLTGNIASSNNNT
ncbi:MAG: NosD domain-containing protein, partial [Candidatus Methanospirareceae archaeon]